MCGGPIRFVSDSGIRSVREYEDSITLLLCIDLVLIDEKSPHIGKCNMLDFFFIAQQDIRASQNAQLIFWFPYASEGGIQPGSGNTERARKQQAFCQHYIEQAIRKRTSPPWAYGWNEKELQTILPLQAEDDVVCGLKMQLERIQTKNFNSKNISVKKCHFNGSADSTHQHFSACINQDIKAGEIIHVYFTAINAIATSLKDKPNSGTAPFYYYYNYSPPVLEYPYKNAPIVPCAVMFAALMLPVRPTYFEPACSFASDLKVGPETTCSPMNEAFADMRWFTMYNAHMGPYDGNFMAEWAFPTCSQECVPAPEARASAVISEKELFFDEATQTFVVNGKSIPREQLTPFSESILANIYHNAIKHDQFIRSERLATTGQLAISIVHEINSPLQGITSLLSVIKKHSQGNSVLLEDLDLVTNAVGNIKNTVENLLYLNRPSKENKQLCNVNAIVDRTIAFLKHHLKKNKIEIIFSPSPKLPEIKASQQQLAQVVINLINNAVEAIDIKFDSVRQIVITTSLEENEIIIKVTDTGPGIPEEALQHIFKFFYTRKKSTGTGVGLYICDAIVNDHGGTITAENSPNGGAVFTIALPIK